MGGIKRNDTLRHRLKLEAVRLREEGHKQTDIAGLLNEQFKLDPPIAQSTVSRYLRAAKNRYIEQTQTETARLIHREKTTLDYVEEEARLAWEAQVLADILKADSNMLKRMLEASDRRAKLLGLIIERSEVDHKGGLTLNADRLAAAQRAAAGQLAEWESERFGSETDGNR